MKVEKKNIFIPADKKILEQPKNKSLHDLCGYFEHR